MGSQVVVQAFNAALLQFVQMHELDPPTTSSSVSKSSSENQAVESSREVAGVVEGKEERKKGKRREREVSALWQDAPLYNSLLATQVREDVRQVLALRRNASSSFLILCYRHICKPCCRRCCWQRYHDDRCRGERRQHQLQYRQANEAKKSNQPRNGPKPIVTIVEHAHLPGNNAWKKAVKTVQTTPNSIGLIANSNSDFKCQHHKAEDAAVAEEVSVEKEVKQRKKERERKREKEKEKRRETPMVVRWLLGRLASCQRGCGCGWRCC